MSALLKPDQFLDPVWRLHNLYWIVDKTGKQVLFQPNQAQMQLLEGLHGRDIILKARQMGFTTLICLIGLDEALFNPNWKVGIIAHKLDDAKAIFGTKVKFPYEKLPDELRDALPLIKDSADTLELGNGSSIEVKTSARSGTYQRLHISEHGKICATAPEKAKEIKTGSLPAAEQGQITIESTAEGKDGDFYDMCSKAQARAEHGKPLTRLQYKFHFFPWWEMPEYQAEPEFVTITHEDEEYFGKLADQGIQLTDEQKAWWVETEEIQGGEMLREYPATPEEAFEQAIEGAIFANQLAHARKHKHIGEFGYDPKYPVNSFWDIGRNDLNCIWLHQHIRGRNRFIGYYENSGEYISHYIQWLAKWAKDNEADWDDHYLPHDADRQDLFLENGRLAVMDDLGFRPKVVERPTDKWVAVETARNVFADCDFDEAACAKGLKRLAHYRKEWDDRRETFRNKPLHDDNSNGADAFMTFSSTYKPRAKKAEPINYGSLGTIA